MAGFPPAFCIGQLWELVLFYSYHSKNLDRYKKLEVFENYLAINVSSEGVSRAAAYCAFIGKNLRGRQIEAFSFFHHCFG